MNIIPITYSSGVYWKELVFVESRLGAEERVVHLKGNVTTQRMKYDAIWKAERDIEFAVTDNQAQVKTAETRVGRYMESVYSDALHDVKQKRKEPRYARLFKMSLSSFKQMTFAAQKEDILRMKDILDLDLYDSSFRDAQNESLDKALAEIDRVLVMQKEIERRQMFYRQDVDVWKNETNQVRMDIYGELILLSETPGESWARSFFPKPKRIKKLSAEEIANREEQREQKRLDKVEKDLKFQKVKLEEAAKKAQIEREKAETEARIKDESKSGPASGKDGSAPKGESA